MPNVRLLMAFPKRPRILKLHKNKNTATAPIAIRTISLMSSSDMGSVSFTYLDEVFLVFEDEVLPDVLLELPDFPEVLLPEELLPDVLLPEVLLAEELLPVFDCLVVFFCAIYFKFYLLKIKIIICIDVKIKFRFIMFKSCNVVYLKIFKFRGIIIEKVKFIS